MKTSLLLLLAAGFASAAPGAFEVRPGEGTLLELTVEKTGFLSGKRHLFTFSRYQGVLLFDRDAPENSGITLAIDAASIACQDIWLGARDLRKVQEYAVKDMLAINRYPRITFKSTVIRKLDASHFEAQGILTIRDVSRPAVVTAALNIGSGGFPLLEGSARIKLTDFGLKPPSAALGTIGTKNEMVFRFILNAMPVPVMSASE